MLLFVPNKIESLLQRCGRDSSFVSSVVVFGRCHVIEDKARALEMVKKFAMKYYPDERTADEEIEESKNAFCMFEIKIEHLSGKEIQEK